MLKTKEIELRKLVNRSAPIPEEPQNQQLKVEVFEGKDEERPGAVRAALISHALWMRRFAGQRFHSDSIRTTFSAFSSPLPRSNIRTKRTDGPCFVV